MMYLSWYTASATCCQNHSGHAWSLVPSCIFTGINHTGRVRAIWNQIHNQHVMCGNHLLADNFCVATHQPGPHIIPGSEMAAFKCFFNKLPLQECTASYSLLLSYHLSTCWIPKAFLLNGEKLHWAKPCQEKRKRLEFSPSRPALGFWSGASWDAQWTPSQLG